MPELHTYVWKQTPHWARCLHLMRGLRGNWERGRWSEMLQLLYKELALADIEGLANKQWLAAVKANADTFDGHYNDGRIFRDGQRLMPAEIAKAFGLTPSKGDPDGFVSASGDIAASLGATQVDRGGWYGNYNESPVPGTEAPTLIGECPAGDCMEEEHAVQS